MEGVTRRTLVWLGDELGGVFEPAVDAVRRRQWWRFSMGPAAMLLVISLAIAFRTHPGHTFLEDYAITRPADGWNTVPQRLPLSMFAPAALLPYWFAVLQVGLVYGLAQALVGWWRTLAVAVAGHSLATFSAHLWILTGPPLGVGHRFDHFGDAGPSVAVVGLIAYIAVVRKSSWLAAAMIAYHSIEIGIFNGLSQREHLIGTATGVAAAALTRRGTGRAVRGAALAPALPTIPVQPLLPTPAAQANS